MTSRASESGIAGRFSDYYRRQIAWMEESVAALDTVLNAPGEPDYERWVAEDATRSRRLDELIAEHTALKKEWDTARDLDASARSVVEGLRSRVAELRVDFDRRRVAAVARLAQAADAMRGEAGELRRGRENARKYGANEDDGGTIVDRRA